MDTKQNSYLVPGAIVVAGLLIAGAVIYINGTPGTPSNLGGDNGTGESAAIGVVDAAKAIGLNKGDFESCLEGQDVADAVEEDSQDAIASGGTGTPYSIVISPSGAKYPVFGALPIGDVKAIIDGALADDATLLADLEVQVGGAVGNIRPLDENDHIQGNLDAEVVLIEYSDLECPFCQSFHITAQQVIDDYDGQVAWVYRHFPLDSIHPFARPLAEGSECAAKLGGSDAFWKYLDKVFGI